MTPEQMDGIRQRAEARGLDPDYVPPADAADSSVIRAYDIRALLDELDRLREAAIRAAMDRERLGVALVEANRYLGQYWDAGGDAGDEEQLALAQGVIRDALAMVLRWQATVPEPVREYRTQKGMGL